MSHYNPEDGGIQFEPYEDELIKRFLIPKLKGEPYPFEDKIVMKDVYAKEPWLLDHTRGSFFKTNEWYYFVARTQVSKKKTGCGQNAKRKITGGNDGWTWKGNATSDIIDEETEMVIGTKQTLKYFTKSNKNKKLKRGDGTSCDIIVRGSDSSWYMTEYMLPDYKDGTFQTLVLCKIHEIKMSKDDHHEASSSSYHHESFSSSEQQPITSDHESVLASSFSDELQQKQSINEAHRREAEIPRIGAEKNDQVIFGKIQESYKSKKKDNHHEASTYRHYLDSTSKQQLINIGYESVIASSSEQQPINTICKIQEDKKDDHKAHQYDSVADSSSEKQPINEVQRHNPEILHIGAENNVGSEKNDQVFETSRLKVDENVTVKEMNGGEICENLGREKDKQEEEEDCIQKLVGSLTMTVNGSDLPKEEDDTILIYNTSLIDQDLLDQYATLRPKESSQH